MADTTAAVAVSTRWADLPTNLSLMPALTIQQPWTTAILAGVKRVENRSWPPRRHATQWMWLHEGGAVDRGGRQFITDLGHPGLAAVEKGRKAGIVAAMRIDLTVCALPPEYCQCGPWAFPEALHWRITDVLPLPRRVLCRGWQQQWWPDRAVLDQIRDQIGATR